MATTFKCCLVKSSRDSQSRSPEMLASRMYIDTSLTSVAVTCGGIRKVEFRIFETSAGKLVRHTRTWEDLLMRLCHTFKYWHFFPCWTHLLPLSWKLPYSIVFRKSLPPMVLVLATSTWPTHSNFHQHLGQILSAAPQDPTLFIILSPPFCRFLLPPPSYFSCSSCPLSITLINMGLFGSILSHMSKFSFF